MWSNLDMAETLRVTVADRLDIQPHDILKARQQHVHQRDPVPETKMVSFAAVTEYHFRRRYMPKALVTIYRAMVESVLTISFTVWFDWYARDDERNLSIRVVDNASSKVGAKLQKVRSIFVPRADKYRLVYALI